MSSSGSKPGDRNRDCKVAVVGATGVVGAAMLDILASRGFPAAKLTALASARSAGQRLRFGDRELAVQVLDDFDFNGTDVALFSAGAAISAQHAPRAVAAGCVVIDNTSQFRYEPQVPLVVPEVNAHAAAAHRGIIANPNCSTIQLVVALKPLYDAAGIARINVCTYQAVSGAGRGALEQMQAHSEALLQSPLLQGRTLKPAAADEVPVAAAADEAPPAAFNAVPHIDRFQDNGYTREEMKILWETRKILEDEAIQINATAVRVPVFYGHSEAVHLETRDKLSAAQARALLQDAPGITLMDEHSAGGYPTAALNAAGADAVFVGRIREDISHPKGLNLWVVSDNVRKGAALNSVQIAELPSLHIASSSSGSRGEHTEGALAAAGGMPGR